uniref:RFX1-4/6/8-like BCD domain-containing protein n=1 Tax=Panagrolaimus davidi TaxID=227884 RepID=A0A914PVT9_9BILA
MDPQQQQQQQQVQLPKSPHHEVSEGFAAMMGQLSIPSIEIPSFEDSEAFLISMDLEIIHANKFMDDYLAASTEMLHLIEQQRFKSVENLWLNFWSGNRNGSLTQEQMFNLVTIPDIFKTIDKIDQLFYQSAVDLLMPNVFAPLSNMKYLTAIRNFVKQIVPIFKKALEKAPMEFLNLKIASGKAFFHRMKRYTAIHHLSDAARAVLSHPKQVETMYNEFCQIDIASIQEQAGWICECDPLLFNSIFNAFKENLKAGRELEAWAEWMEAIVDQVLAKYHDQPLHVQVTKSKRLIHDWNYYSSAIIRDLTLRSANSFGSFHLLKILFEDYIFYLVELRLAKVANTPVVCLLSGNWIGNSNLHHMDFIDPSLSTSLQQPPAVVTQMIMHNDSVTSSNIQYVVTDHQPKYVFSNTNGYLMTPSNDDYVMVSTSEGHHYVDHQLLGNGAQQLETIVYVDEHGQQTTAENSAARYIVMTGLPSVGSGGGGEALDIESSNVGGMGQSESSFETSAKIIRTADEMVLSGDILEANDETDVKQS